MTRLDSFKGKDTSYKKTQEYKNWKMIVSGAKEFPVETFLQEVFDSHKNRKSRLISLNRVSAKKLIDASGQDVNFRSRCVEIMAKAKRIQFSVHIANENLTDFLISENYVSGKTQGDRIRYASTIIKDGVEINANLESFIEVMTDFIADIDQSGWSMKRMMEGIVIASKAENIL